MGRSIVAGLASGALMGVFFLGVAVIAIVSEPRAVARLTNLSFQGMSTVKTSVLGAMTTVVAWSLVGALLGLVNFAVAMIFPGGGVGSPTAVYTASIVVIAFGFVLVAAIYERRHIRSAIATGLGFAAVFGWLLPWLAYQ